MIGVGIITHGEFAHGLKHATHMIMGDNPQFDVLSLTEGADMNDFSEDVFSLANSLNEGDGVLLFVDMFGATPFNTIAAIRERLHDSNIAVQIITGVNLSMVIESLAMRQGNSLNDLVPAIEAAGKESIRAVELPK
ncbi:PTS sugar transporter subunit IIA [Alkalibacterium sp. MB6]|uniref:PTS sugar transporter subunit IIA n=1 Tax=Alkalibacterium sp. MB6 TaxID=2081965 RepID=UPI0013797B72|nr:PTS sugar transporter subunit IIA [Alkalibacterium sp. MB6]